MFLQQNAVSFGLTVTSLTPLIYAHLQTWPSVIVPTVLTPIFNFDAVLYTLNMPVMQSQYPDAVCVWTYECYQLNMSMYFIGYFFACVGRVA
jgi:hypothetical protein